MKQTTLSRAESAQSPTHGFWRMLVIRFFADGARDWGISPGQLKLMLTVPFVIAFSGVVAALLGKDAYKMLTGEDRIAEYLQVLCWGTSLLLTVGLVKNSKVHGKNLIAGLYVLLAIGIIFLIGEEISWGQRLFGWATPEAYKAINKQEETNLHNIHGVGYTFKWLHMLIGAYGAFLPLMLLRVPKGMPWREDLSMIIPPVTLVPFFLMPFVWRFYRNLFEAPKDFYFVVSEYSEVMELVLASGFVFFLFYQKRRLDRRKQALNNGRA